MDLDAFCYYSHFITFQDAQCYYNMKDAGETGHGGKDDEVPLGFWRDLVNTVSRLSLLFCTQNILAEVRGVDPCTSRLKAMELLFCITKRPPRR